jgi:hypothetical protein
VFSFNFVITIHTTKSKGNQMINILKKGIIAIIISIVSVSSFSAGVGSYVGGTGSGADGTNSTAVGNNVSCGNVIATDVTCVGEGSGGSTNAVVVGTTSSAGQNATVIGSHSTGNNNSVSIGYNNYITGGNIGIGNNIDMSSLSLFNAIVFSPLAGFTGTLRTGEMNIGGRTLGGVANAIFSDQAVNFGQMTTAINTAVSSIPSSGGGGTTTIINNNGVGQAYVDTSSATTLNSAKSYTDSSMQQATKQANDYTNSKFDEAKQYAYSAAALGMASSSIIFDPRYKQQIAIATSSVNGYSALAVGIAWRANDRSMFNMKAGLAGKGMSGVSAGMTIGF